MADDQRLVESSQAFDPDFIETAVGEFGEGKEGLLNELVVPHVAQIADVKRREATARGWFNSHDRELELDMLYARRVVLVSELAAGLCAVAQAAFPYDPQLQNALMWKVLMGESTPPALLADSYEDYRYM
jgi:hypothetical protein